MGFGMHGHDHLFVYFAILRSPVDESNVVEYFPRDKLPMRQRRSRVSLSILQCSLRLSIRKRVPG